jgi:hypothetical protein
VTVPKTDPGFEVVEDAKTDPGFEVVEDTKAPLAPPPAAKPAPIRAQPIALVDDHPPKGRVRDQGDEDENDRPRKKRRDNHDEDRPKKKRKFKPKKAEETPSHFAFERWLLSRGVVGGLISMAVAVVGFLVGLANDRIMIYTPILFVLGLFAVLKGFMGGREE